MWTDSSRRWSKHGFDSAQLHQVLAQAERYDWIIRLMDAQAPTTAKPTGPTGAWNRYRAKFITPDNVQNGVSFWREYENELNRAQQVYGVPPEIIVGIIGVETRWGRVMGKTRILDALATLAFDYPRRAEFFTSELESFLVMTRDEGMDPPNPRALRRRHGLRPVHALQLPALRGGLQRQRPHQPVGSGGCHRQRGQLLQGPRLGERATGGGAWSGQLPGYEHGFQTRYPVASLRRAGLTPPAPSATTARRACCAWMSAPAISTGTACRTYTITRYNHSTHYAMAVWQLGLAVKDARGGY